MYKNVYKYDKNREERYQGTMPCRKNAREVKVAVSLRPGYAAV
jgi:hypothetical protein